MSTNVTLFSSAETSVVPQHILDRGLSTATQNLVSSGADRKRITIRAGKFRLEVNGAELMTSPNSTMDVVVVRTAANNARTYYESAYEPDSKAAPDCSSADGVNSDPSGENVQSLTCAACPQNAKGSGKGDTKACKFSRRLAVVMANDIGGDVHALKLSSTAIFGKGDGSTMPLETYARLLKSNNVSIDYVITRLHIDDSDHNMPAKLAFSAAGYLSDDDISTVKAQGESQAAAGITDVQIVKKAKPVVEAAVPKKKAAVKAVVADEDNIPEPVIASAKTSRETALKDTIDAWG